MRGHSHRSTTGPLAKRLERNFQKYVNILTLGSGVENKAPKFVFISKILKPPFKGSSKRGRPPAHKIFKGPKPWVRGEAHLNSS